MDKALNVGVVGCGDISSIYMERGRSFGVLLLKSCADLVTDRAKAQAKRFDIERVLTTKELLADPDIDVVLNITPPAAHFEVGLAALDKGKHLYNEKPLALNRGQGRKLLETAKAKNLRIGCAPDTFMGAGVQTAIRLIDEGALGEVTSALAFMACHGHEHWHPSPEFFYQPGGGPLFDMGPYYLTALCAALGPVKRVSGSTKTSATERVVDQGEYKGRRIEVKTPTHVTALLEFECAAAATLVMSFDVWAHDLPFLEIHGTKASLSMPDPNTFGGPLRLFDRSVNEWMEVPIELPYAENSRSVGLADMARAILANHPHRASGGMAYHVLDVMEAVYDSARVGRFMDIESSMDRPAPMEGFLS